MMTIKFETNSSVLIRKYTSKWSHSSQICEGVQGKMPLCCPLLSRSTSDIGYVGFFPYRPILQQQLDVLQFHSALMLSRSHKLRTQSYKTTIPHPHPTPSDANCKKQVPKLPTPSVPLGYKWEVSITPSSGLIICQNNSRTQESSLLTIADLLQRIF